MRNAAFQCSIIKFLSLPDHEILGTLTASFGFNLELLQNNAWQGQIACLKSALSSFTSGEIFLEFVIPRMGKRADAVIVINDRVLVLEFKVGTQQFERSAIEQAHDYALDLKNFHVGSHDAVIIPIVVATDALVVGNQQLCLAADGVSSPLLANTNTLPDLLVQLASSSTSKQIDINGWLVSGYRPTPTIIEAAQALYEHHGVEEITRSDASARNLSDTTIAIQKVIEDAKVNGHKAICFVTGVPGAGKTLAGLNIATKRADKYTDEHAVFLSGNVPLVEVLRGALARDKSRRDGIPLKDALRIVKTFVQPIHNFRDEYIRDPKPPIERVVIFDEAQRAWTKDKVTRFMRARGNHTFNVSEPEFLISVMNRHDGWAVIVCLVGGGQEIHTGEAGLSEWMTALREQFSNWRIFMSDRLRDIDYVSLADGDNAIVPNGTIDENFHLSVSIRSYRAEALSTFVGHLLNNQPDDANRVFSSICERYPLVLARDLQSAKEWLRRQARGSERFGVVASSGARRLRPEGIEIRQKIDPAAWFLNDRIDVRSAFYCEEVATEFDIQGLELDWAAVCWDADLRYKDEQWECFNFKGTSWQQVRSLDSRVYLKNAYRVLLTRARQGMVIFVPKGLDSDPTRLSYFYNGTYEYLIRCGIRAL